MAKVADKADKNVELRHDGWERFERAITAAAKSGPKHRTPIKSGKSARPKRAESQAKKRRKTAS